MSSQQVGILILVVVAVIVAAVLLRKQQSSATASLDVNAEMLFLADDAVKWAAEKNVTLDYTPESVERVEGLLAELHEKRAAGQLFDDQVKKAAVRYGAYVGEVIRRMHNGSWAIDHEAAGPGSFPIRWRDHESFPLGWCSKRILNGEEDNVWFKFRVLVLGDAKDATVYDLRDAAQSLRTFRSRHGGFPVGTWPHVAHRLVTEGLAADLPGRHRLRFSV